MRICMPRLPLASAFCPSAHSRSATPAIAAGTPATVTFTKRHRADLPGEVSVVPSTKLDCADVAHRMPGCAAMGAIDLQTAMSTRQMPPWHIDPVSECNGSERHLAHADQIDPS